MNRIFSVLQDVGAGLIGQVVLLGVRYPGGLWLERHQLVGTLPKRSCGKQYGQEHVEPHSAHDCAMPGEFR